MRAHFFYRPPGHEIEPYMSTTPEHPNEASISVHALAPHFHEAATRWAERLGLALGGKRETFYGLAGVGDLMATAASLSARAARP